MGHRDSTHLSPRAQRVRDHRITGQRSQGEVLKRQALGTAQRQAERPALQVGRPVREVLAIVKGAGYADAVHVGGGVVAWVSQVDPSQPAY